MENSVNPSTTVTPALTEIYSVSFHTKSPTRTHTFWFTDLDMAVMFNESLLMHPKVTDCRVYAVQANLGTEYIKDPEMGGISEIEMWERGRAGSRRKGDMRQHKAADAAERKET